MTDCTFEGCGMATSDDGSTSGTTLLGCRIRDWGRNGVFINNGANISNTSFDQHDPNAADKVTSHAIYVHGSDDLIQGCSFSGVRYYAIQLYGVNGGAISNVRIVATSSTAICTISSCSRGE